jgi:hypothetical protein
MVSIDMTQDQLSRKQFNHVKELIAPCIREDDRHCGCGGNRI